MKAATRFTNIIHSKHTHTHLYSVPRSLINVPLFIKI